MAEKKPIVMQWFRGELEGHYVGTSNGQPAVSQFGSASRYKFRIYRALIRNIEVLESADASSSAASQSGESDVPEASDDPPLDLPENCFYQAQIDDARLLGIRPRSCFEGTVYDVAVSNLEVTHSTKKGSKTYGRLTGEVYGRYLLPPEAEGEEAERVVKELTASELPIKAGSEEPLVDSEAEEQGERDQERDYQPLHPPIPPEDDDAQTPAKIPVPLLIVVMAIVLGLGGGGTPALLWLGFFIPILIIRVIIDGLFKVTAGQRVFGAILILIHAACLGLLMLDWWTLGCKSIDPWLLSGLGVTALITSLMPSPVPLVCTGAGLALVLFLWYGSVGVPCDLPPVEPVIEVPAERPTVNRPGLPRTNDDGSWPRRRPRPQPAP